MNLRIAALCAGASLITALVHAVGVPAAAVAPFAVLDVLFVPGAAVLSALGEWEVGRDDWARAACLVIATSIASEALIGLILYILRVRLGPDSFAVSTLIYVALLTAVTVVRNGGESVKAGTTSAATRAGTRASWPVLPVLACSMSACVLAAAAYLVARHGAISQTYPGFSILSASADTNSHKAMLVVTNHERARATYRFEQPHTAGFQKPFALAPGQTTTRPMVRPTGHRCRETVLIVRARGRSTNLQLCVTARGDGS